MLSAAYYMLRDGLEYRDLGPHYLDQRDRTKTINRLLRRLHDLGCEVAPVAAPSVAAPSQPTPAPIFTGAS
jgi:transposase